MGRTQLQDAVPMRLGQTFHAYATMVKRDYERLKEVRCEMFTVNLGDRNWNCHQCFSGIFI